MPVNILHIITDLSTGGAQRALHNVLAGGLAGEFDSAVISLCNVGTLGECIYALGVPVYTLDIRKGIPGIRALCRLRYLVRDFRPDVIQGWMYHGNLAASMGSKMSSKHPAVVWNVRHSLYNLAVEKLGTQLVIRACRHLSPRVDAVLYNSSLSREQHETFGFDVTRGQVIPNGFDFARLAPNALTAKGVRLEFSIPDHVPVIGHVARFHPMKDHVTFLRAAVKVAKAIPNARFLVVGRDVSPGNPALAGLVPSELLSRFHFPGERSDVTDLMQAMTVLCLSSSWGEAFPNVLGEAMASGVPCVTTDVGDSALIVGDTGQIVPPGDENRLFNGLLFMLNKSNHEREALARAARARIEMRFGLDSVVMQYSDLYQRHMQANLAPR